MTWLLLGITDILRFTVVADIFESRSTIFFLHYFSCFFYAFPFFFLFRPSAGLTESSLFPLLFFMLEAVHSGPIILMSTMTFKFFPLASSKLWVIELINIYTFLSSNTRT